MNPYPTYEALREAGPILLGNGLYHLLSRPGLWNKAPAVKRHPELTPRVASRRNVTGDVPGAGLLLTWLKAVGMWAKDSAVGNA
jgi:hypothetical protein